jgi:Cu(I)/Ag(I) efflux system membrane fusion protein
LRLIGVVVIAMLAAACGDKAPAESPLASTAGEPGELALSAAVLQRLGVRTAVAERGPLRIEMSAVGEVAYDASTIRDVYAPTAGWVEKLAVHSVGEAVRAGELLLELYSPSLATVDEQYLSAVSSGIQPATNPYSGGLRSIGLTEDMIDDLREKKRSPGRIPFRAAADGVVTELGVREGAVVKQGDRLLQSVAVAPVWVNLAIPESAAAHVAAGSDVALAAPAFPGRVFTGRVDLVYPRLDERTRTVGVRVSVPNEDGALKANMFISATLERVVAEPVVHVPTEAVIRGGHGDRVIVALGEGRFARRDVVLGHAARERVAVLSGLAEGDEVVTSGVFLIDAETNLRAGLERLNDAHPVEPAPSSHAH